jgi:dihydrofolate reductase
VRRLSVNTFVTLDGVMQAPGDPEEDTTGGFTHGGWTVNYWDEAMGQRMDEVMGQPFDLLLGRITYEIFAAHWPKAPDEIGAGPLNRATKYVASRTLTSAEWQNSEIIQGDVAEAVTALKRGEGPEIQVHGSSNLIQTLLEHDLVDEFRIWTFPLVLGTGKRLFAGGTMPAGLQLMDSMVSSTGVIVVTYQRSGPIEYGSFALDQPEAGLSG